MAADNGQKLAVTLLVEQKLTEQRLSDLILIKALKKVSRQHVIVVRMRHNKLEAEFYSRSSDARLPYLNYNPNEPGAEFYSRGSDARLPYLNFNPIEPEAEFYSRGSDAKLPTLISIQLNQKQNFIVAVVMLGYHP